MVEFKSAGSHPTETGATHLEHREKLKKQLKVLKEHAIDFDEFRRKTEAHLSQIQMDEKRIETYPVDRKLLKDQCSKVLTETKKCCERSLKKCNDILTKLKEGITEIENLLKP